MLSLGTPAFFVHAAESELAAFEVFDRERPSSWLRLDTLASSDEPAISQGAAELQQLVTALPLMLHDAAPTTVPALWHCHFLQLQTLVRGAEVTAHVDAATPRADLVATLTLSGGESHIGVGPVRFCLEPGDVYAIAGKARWGVSHEVGSGWNNRVSATLRFVLGD